VTRLCNKCKRRRPLREFDLAVIHRAATCRLCTRESINASPAARRVQLDALERQRRTLIADLVKVDFDIAQLRLIPPTAVTGRVPVPGDAAVSDDGCGFGD
jgi:hypothetical protein